MIIYCPNVATLYSGYKESAQYQMVYRMIRRDKSSGGASSISILVLAGMLLLAVLLISGLAFLEYSFAEAHLRENERYLRAQTENIITEEIRLGNDGLEMYDSSLNRELEEAFTLFMQEYEAAGRDPAAMDLGGLKQRLGDRMDLYIINPAGVIEYTTFEPDLGLDFSSIPYFFEYISRIRQTEGFYPDRIVIEPATGVLRKYAYMPSPDHEYLFELGLAGEELEKEVSRLDYLQNAREIASLNPFVDRVRVFTSRKQLESDRGFVPDPELNMILDRVISEKAGLERDDPQNGTKRVYLYIDLRDERYGSDISRIVEITYNTRIIEQRLTELLVLHVIIGLLVMLIVVVAAVVLSRQIRGALEAIVAELDPEYGEDRRTEIMTGKKSRLSSLFKKTSFSLTLSLYFLLIVIISVGSIAAAGMVLQEQLYNEDTATMKVQMEEGLGETIGLMDEGYRLYDDSLNDIMEREFALFREEYEESNRNVDMMNLEEMKSRMGGMFDLYIINESLIIEHTTYPPDQDLDLSVYPHTREYLSRIMLSEGIFCDRIVFETSTGRLRKFAYMPTSDHRYIFELGLSGEAVEKRFESYSPTYAIRKIASSNPFIVELKAFDMIGRMRDNLSYEPSQEERDALEQVMKTRTPLEKEDQEGRMLRRFIYVGLSDPRYASDMSWILEIGYDKERIKATLNRLMQLEAYLAIIASFAGFAGALLISGILTRPVKRMARDASMIASGQIGHPIAPSELSEFELLEESITRMVQKLREMIEELKSREKELRNSEKRFRDLAELLPQAIFETDCTGRITFANRSGLLMFGYSEEDLGRGYSIFDFITPDERGRVEKIFQQALWSRIDAGNEFRFLKRDGSTFHGLVFTSPILEGDSCEGLRGVLVDISKLKEAEQKLKHMADELESRVRERTAALESANRDLESFSYSISHDLRGPLRAMDGYSAILAESLGGEFSPRVQYCLDKIQQSAREMAKLIDSLLLLSKVGRRSLYLEDVDMTPLVDEVYHDLLREPESRGAEFILHRLPQCRADRSLLRQVLYNLLSNALKFSRHRKNPRIEVGAFPEEGVTVYFVRDNGIGFDMRHAKKIFEIFQRLNPEEYSGEGIGLAISERIIRMHGGRIWAESSPDAGATFFFTLGGSQLDKGT